MVRLNKQKSTNQLRIVGGKWRGRKMAFPEIEGLIPTMGRVRETVFNWLQFIVGGARCLDLFAGSGALGFEAASRGAGSVTMIESDPEGARQLEINSQLFAAEHCHVENKTAQQFLLMTADQYDIVFIDPPYQADLWTEVATLLMENGILADNAYVYLECPSKKELPVLPVQWQLIRDRKAGKVRYCLFMNKLGEAT